MLYEHHDLAIFVLITLNFRLHFRPPERAISGTGHVGDALAIDALATLVRTNPTLALRLTEKIAECLHDSSSCKVRRTIDVSCALIFRRRRHIRHKNIISTPTHLPLFSRPFSSRKVLDTCMHSAGDAFRHEIGKFRFLNVIVLLLSPTHAIRPTTPIIRQRLMDLLLCWTAQYAGATKIREAYDMLRKQGVPHAAPSDHSVAERVHAARPVGKEHTVFDSIPRELLRSQRPQDVQTAKLLIEQALERERRTEALQAQHRDEVQLAIETAGVLDAMLGEWELPERQQQRMASASAAATAKSADELGLLSELYEQCRSLLLMITSYPATGGDSAATEADTAAPAVDETQQAVDSLQAAIQRYLNTIVEGRPAAHRMPAVATSQPAAKVISNTELLADIMSEAPSGTLPGDTFMLLARSAATTAPSKLDDFAALDDIFTKPSKQTSCEYSAPSLSTDVLLLADDNATASTAGSEQLLSPTTTTTTAPLDATKPTLTKRQVEVQVAKPVSELDMFGLDSVITGLKNNLVGQLVDKPTPTVNASPVDAVDAVAESANTSSDDDEIIALSTVDEPEPLQKSATLALADLHIDLANIRPSQVPARIVLDDPLGLKVVLNFAADRPRDDVGCYVLTITNQARQPIRGLSVIASASKPCKVRQMPASGSDLAACKPFRPPTEDVTQVLLVANATGQPYDLMCIMSYHLGDDPDEMKELINVSGLPANVD